MSTPLPEMDRLTLRFGDPAVEEAYLRDFARTRRQSIQYGVVLLATLYAAFGIVDAFVFPEILRPLLVVRFAVVEPLLLAALPLVLLPRFRPLFERRAQELLLALGVVATGGILAMGRVIAERATPQQIVVGTLGLLTTLTFLFGSTHLRFVYATLLGTGASLTGLGFLIAYFRGPPSLWVGIVFFGFAVNVTGWWISRTLERIARRDFLQREATALQRERAERLLANVLPSEIARRLLAEDGDLAHERSALADRHEAVTVIVADLVGFTQLADRLSPVELAAILDRQFSRFDLLGQAHGVEKIKTLGDAWIGAAGVLAPQADHALATARLALEMRAAVAELAAQVGEPLAVRIGIHSGAAIAGVIGRTRFAYDLWGEAVDGAKAAEQAAEPGHIRVSAATRALLEGKLAAPLTPIDGDMDGDAWLGRELVP